MDKNNHIDDLFRSKLTDYKPEYVPEHWQMMKAAMESSPKAIPVSSGNFTARFLIALSAVILLSSGIYTYLLTRNYQSIDNKGNTIAMTSQGNNISKQIVAADRNPAISGINTLPVVKNNTLSQNGDIADANQNTSINKGNTNKEKVQKKTAFQTKSADKNKLPITDNKIKVDKPLINNVETAVLSDKKVIENTSLNETRSTIDENVVPINSVLPETVNNVVSMEQADNKKVLIDSENDQLKNEEYSSVTDDYLAQKEKSEKKYKRVSERKANRNKIYESIPDCKVGMVNNFVINPAFAGCSQRHTINLSTIVHKPLYKPSDNFNVPFEYGIAYDFNFGKRRNCGIGLNYKRYLGAAEGSLALDVTFAYRFLLATNHSLRVGISASYLASDINHDNLSFSDMIDFRDGFVYNTQDSFPTSSTRNNFDMGIGLWYKWKTLFVGVSAIHLTSPEVGVVSTSRIPREYLLSAGYGFNMGKSISALPAIELKYNERILNVSPSMLFAYRKWFIFGVEFQNLRNAGLVFGCNLKNTVIINLRGGIPMNKDIIRNFGILDYTGLSLRFQFGKKR